MRSLLAIALVVGWTSVVSAEAPPSLGAAASFAVLGNSSVKSSGARVGGNVGVSHGTISGPISFSVGDKFQNDVAARGAQSDSAATYEKLAALPCTVLGDRPAPGVYCVGPSLPETLILDAHGASDAVWIFQGDFTAAPGTKVLLLNGASRDNVFWLVPGSATLGNGSLFAGNILAVNNIDIQSGTRLSGRALAQKGAVTLGEDARVSMCCPLVTLSPQTLPDAVVGQNYPPPPISPANAVVTSGSLPPGLTPAITGTPTTPGKYRFTLTASGAERCTGTVEYEINVTGCPAITIAPERLTPLVDGCAVRYQQLLTANGGTGPYTFSATMPAEMTLIDGTISGTPSGCTSFEVTARDANGCEGKRRYDVCGWPIDIAPVSLPDGCVNEPYDAVLTATGGIPPYTWSICTGQLPHGLQFSAAGLIAGTPTEAGLFTFTVTAADITGSRGSRTYALRITNCQPGITVLPLAIPDGFVGRQYDNVQFTAEGGKPPYVFSSTALPLDLHLVQSSGVLAGIPKEAGPFEFVVTATDADQRLGMRKYHVTFRCDITIAPESPVLPGATVCAPYSQQFSATGAIGPYTFTSSGPLPAGLSPLTSDGLLAGTPTESGDFSITITASDTTAHCSSEPKSYTLHVNGGGGGSPITGVSTTLPSGVVFIPYSQPLPVVGGTLPLKFKVVTGSGTSVPPGLGVSSAGVLSGIPTKGGSYRFNVDVTSSGACSAHRITYTVAIFPLP